MNCLFSHLFSKALFSIIVSLLVFGCSQQEDIIDPTTTDTSINSKAVPTGEVIIVSTDGNGPFLRNLQKEGVNSRKGNSLLNKYRKHLAWNKTKKMVHADGSNTYAVPIDDNPFELKNLIVIEKDGQLEKEVLLKFSPSLDLVIDACFPKTLSP